MGNLMEEGVVRDMTPRLIGETYRKYPTEKSNRKYSFGLYECQYCKKEFEAQVSNIKNGNTKSCGCLNGDAHGLTSHKFYHTWRQMVQRCTNPKIKVYKDYGGRGISVCEEWLNIRNFVDWAEKTHPNQEGYTLDRINNDKGYSPENCTWSDKTTQNINQRMNKSNTSGFVGIYWNKASKKWDAKIGVNSKLVHIGTFHAKEEAVQARDNYIIENNLSHKLSTDYVKEQINE